MLVKITTQFFFFKESPYCSPWWLYQFSVPPTMQIMPVWSKQRLATRFGHHEVESSLPPEGSVMARAHCHLYINILTCAIKVLACLVSRSTTCIFFFLKKKNAEVIKLQRSWFAIMQYLEEATTGKYFIFHWGFRQW